MKMFSNVWQLIVHSEEIDKQLSPYLVERIEGTISKYDAVELYKNFIELPDHVGDMVTGPFRKKSLQLLANGQHSLWDKVRAKAMFDLLNLQRLRWIKSEYFTVLETVSNLSD